MIPLLFVPASRQKPLQVHVLYLSAVTGGNLSQPYRFRLLFSRFGAPLGSHVRLAPPPLSLQNRNGFRGLVNSHMQMYSLRHCVLFLCTGFMLTHLHQFVNRKKARRTGIFSYSPHSAKLFIHRNNYLWFALITDIAASFATTVRSL